MSRRFLSGAAVAAAIGLLSAPPSSAAADKPAPPPPPPPLFTAAGKGDAAEVTRLLGAGAAVEEPNKAGVTPLMYAAEGGRIEVMKLLLAAGADPKRATPTGVTALHHAAAACSPEGAKFLLGLKVGVDPQTEKGHQTPLLTALSAKCWRVAELLLGAGADLRSTEAGRRALVFALPVIREGVFDDERPPLDPALAKVLVDKGAALDAVAPGGWTLMHLAARSRNAAMVRFLSQNGMKANVLTDDGMSPLLLASTQANLESFISGLTLFTGMSPDIQAVAGGEEGRALERRLRTQSAGRFGNRLVDGLRALQASRRATIEALLATGADPNVMTKDGETALTRAASEGDAGSVDALLIGGADADAIQAGHYSALMRAAHSGHREVVKALLDHGARPDLTNSSGETALMRGAVAGGDATVVRLLLQAGAKADLRNNDGQSALIYALGGHKDVFLDGYASNPELTEVVALLLAAGADAAARDAKGQTPESLAKAPKYKPALRPVQAALKNRPG